MKTYFAYVRVSTVRQGVHGVSLQEQQSAIEAYAQRHGLTINRWFEERETAAKSGRRRFAELITALKREDAAGVIIHKIDRSARNLQDWANLGGLVDQGFEFHFAHETLDLTTRGGRLAADIQAVVAADYIRNLRQETLKGMYGRLKQGIYPFRAPIGYLDRGRGKPKDPCPVLAPLVSEAFEFYATGQYSLEALRLLMHGRGLVGHSGRALSRNGLAKILHNPFYMGVIRLHKTRETFSGAHTAIVSTPTFERVQEVLSGRFYRRPVRHVFAYSRMIQCSRCGLSLIGELQKGRCYYRCHSHDCRGTSVREDAIDAELHRWFGLLALDDAELGDLRAFGDDDAVGRKTRARASRANARLELGRSEDRLNRLTDAYLDAAIDKATFERRKAALLIEAQGYRETLSTPEKAAEHDELLNDLELGNMAQLRFQMASAPEKREIAQELTSNLCANGKSLDSRLRFPFDVIAKWRLVHDGDPKRAGPRTSADTNRSNKANLRELYQNIVHGIS